MSDPFQYGYVHVCGHCGHLEFAESAELAERSKAAMRRPRGPGRPKKGEKSGGVGFVEHWRPGAFASQLRRDEGKPAL